MDSDSGVAASARTPGGEATLTEAVNAEVEKIRTTANQMAERESDDVGKDVRVLAGLVQQLAEQVERLTDAAEENRSDRH